MGCSCNVALKTSAGHPTVNTIACCRCVSHFVFAEAVVDVSSACNPGKETVFGRRSRESKKKKKNKYEMLGWAQEAFKWPLVIGSRRVAFFAVMWKHSEG